VYRHTIEEGFYKGAVALRQRIKKCRKGYQLYTGPKGFEMELVDGSVINEDEISPRLLEPIYSEVHGLLRIYTHDNNPLQMKETKTNL